jgi:DNA-dependent RNA polymerase auxiliary subunit epsilon
VLVRGNTQTILDKVYGNDIKLTEISRKLIEEKGFHVELIAKTTLHMKDFEEIEKAYHSASIEKSFFYKNLDRYINRVEPMGLLIFVNQFYQKKIDDSLRNPVLNKSLIHKFK